MENKINYAWLDETLKKAGLILTNHKTHGTRREDEKKGCLLEVSVESEMHPVMISKRLAVYQNLQASGRTPNEVARAIFQMMTTSIIVLIGTYNNYKEKVVYENDVFKRVVLSKEELVEINSPY